MAEEQRSRDENGAPGFWQVTRSVLASFFGVQSREALERDARARSPLPYIVVGVVGTALFITAVITVVRLVLHAAGR